MESVEKVGASSLETGGETCQVWLLGKKKRLSTRMTGEVYRREERLAMMLWFGCSDTEGKTGGRAGGHAG